MSNHMSNRTTRLGDINHWLQIIATLGVIASIIFLGFELRQNRQLMKAQIYQSRAEMIQNTFLVLSESEHLVPIFNKLETARDESASFAEAVARLSSEEKIRLGFYYERQIRHLDNMYYQYELGLIDDEYMQWWEDDVTSSAPKWNEVLGDDIPGRQSFVGKVQELIDAMP